MRLTLTITSGPAPVAPDRRSLDAGQLSIGRAPENDWVLPDPDRLLSKRHCVVGLRGDSWLVADTSRNGTYLNTAEAPIGQGGVARLQHGDRLRLGAYELLLQLDGTAPAATADPTTVLPPPAAAIAPPTPTQAADPLAAFLQGAGIAARPADPAAALRRVGAAFRAAVIGLRQALAARSAVKGAFRIDGTLLRARNNNPLKFAASDEAALLSLVLGDRPADLGAEQAISEALRDLRHHELATMAAMQTAVRALLRRLDPAALREAGEKSGGLLPAQRRARAFELFEQAHAELGHALADDFDGVFGAAFAAAYDQAMADIAGREDA